MKVELLTLFTINKGINMTAQQNTLDFGKPIQTRDGQKVRIVSTGFEFNNPGQRYPIIAEVEYRGYVTYNSLGEQYEGCQEDNDLVNIPEETFEQKVERFKKSEYFISEKKNRWDTEVVIWTHAAGFEIFNTFEGAMHEVDFD